MLRPSIKFSKISVKFALSKVEALLLYILKIPLHLIQLMEHFINSQNGVLCSTVMSAALIKEKHRHA